MEYLRAQVENKTLKSIEQEIQVLFIYRKINPNRVLALPEVVLPLHSVGFFVLHVDLHVTFVRLSQKVKVTRILHTLGELIQHFLDHFLVVCILVLFIIIIIILVIIFIMASKSWS